MKPPTLDNKIVASSFARKLDKVVPLAVPIGGADGVLVGVATDTCVGAPVALVLGTRVGLADGVRVGALVCAALGGALGVRVRGA